MQKQKTYVNVDCTNYDKITKRILIIKLGAIGDVIRTTPLVEKYRTSNKPCPDALKTSAQLNRDLV